jgi:FKBP-type peptidyl-prolyl cis-trans isomerase (trigger factor)
MENTNMHQVITALLTELEKLAIASAAHDSEIGALKDALLKNFPQIEDDYYEQLKIEKERSKVYVESVQRALATLRQKLAP